MTALNIVFAGTPEFGLPCLKALATSKHTIKAIYTQPDRPAGRGRMVQESAIKTWARTHKLPICQPVNFKDPATIAQLASFMPDVIVVIAYGLILPVCVLTLPTLGCINVHASLLPRWRGASPIQQAILSGDRQSGITIMQMDKGMDTGDMLMQATCFIDPNDTASHLHDRLAQLAVTPLLTTLDALTTDVVPTKQNATDVTYAPKINKIDALIDWKLSAVAIDRQVRAFNPWPIAYTSINGQVLRVHQAKRLEQDAHALPGTILSIDKTGVLVATGNQTLLIERLQFPGGKTLWVRDWLNANHSDLQVGLILQ